MSEQAKKSNSAQTSDSQQPAVKTAKEQDSSAESHKAYKKKVLTDFTKTAVAKKYIEALPDYEILGELGRGSQGHVLLGRRKSDDTKVAIKVLYIDSVKNWKDYELFHREADTLASLEIPGVARFYEAIERLEDNPPCSYLIQEYIEGSSLNDMLKSGHRFSFVDVYDIILQLLVLLHDLHLHNPPVIHRDIKPSNILLKHTDNGYVVHLIDFGAVANPQVQGGGSTVAGTYGYMPPEQLMGKPTPASDIYSLAAVAVYLLSGRSPADMPIKDFHLIFEPDLQNMPPAVVNTLRSMLEPAPDKRLCDYDTLYDLFENFQNDIYESTGVRQKVLTPEEFNAKLKGVEYFEQNGNLELWQELSDRLPREDRLIPVSYLKIPSYHNQLHSDGLSVFKETSFERNGEETRRSGLIVFLFVALYLLFFTAISFLAFIQNYKSLFITSILIGIALLPIFVSRVHGSKRYQVTLPSSNLASSQSQLRELLKSGRKTIATIVSVEYCTIAKESRMDYEDHFEIIRDVEVNYADNKTNGPMARFACHRAPKFRIGYKFNPPDDVRSEDLIHYITTYVEPEKHYKVGDPLPILYRMYKSINKKSASEQIIEHVVSMPFPMPLDLLYSADNVYAEDQVTYSNHLKIRGVIDENAVGRRKKIAHRWVALDGKRDAKHWFWD